MAAEGALGMAFTPDGMEMFVTNHKDGGISRYKYDGVGDTWTEFGDVVQTPMLASIAVTTVVQ